MVRAANLRDIHRQGKRITPPEGVPTRGSTWSGVVLDEGLQAPSGQLPCGAVAVRRSA
jgi:hypothetical protein